MGLQKPASRYPVFPVHSKILAQTYLSTLLAMKAHIRLRRLRGPHFIWSRRTPTLEHPRPPNIKRLTGCAMTLEWGFDPTRVFSWSFSLGERGFCLSFPCPMNYGFPILKPLPGLASGERIKMFLPGPWPSKSFKQLHVPDTDPRKAATQEIRVKGAWLL